MSFLADMSPNAKTSPLTWTWIGTYEPLQTKNRNFFEWSEEKPILTVENSFDRDIGHGLRMFVKMWPRQPHISSAQLGKLF